MVCRIAAMMVWVVAVTVEAAAIVVAENGTIMCSPFNTMEESAHPWTDDCYGEWMGKQDLKEGVQNLRDKAKQSALDGKKYASEKADVISNSSSFTKDGLEEVYNEAKHKVEEAYESMTKSGLSEEAKAKYVAAKERASDVAGEVGAKCASE
ncbi:uncharacterized protein LOC110682497 isoform X2 [Chenopodium quinoa]|uniref:uncharacterized protein LOC110682497 isoform X2 n=1 Tax=Chenopodium quinoa TaxID=63459 RepID=UPI000B79179C|nr:uncharacterized protein LOC110682497 isoform X2 [Chenopodium quinoa]